MEQDILQFWFEDLKPEQWWSKNPELDIFIRSTYGTLHKKISCGECWKWRETSEGRLAEILVLDQFSRHIYRDQPKAFAFDGMALILAQEAIHHKAHQNLSLEKKGFMLLPFMHSESLEIHEEAVKLYSEPGLESYLDYELKHKEIIERFGRYPHRNEILGRSSTDEEIEFLEQEGSWF
jgi:uncharacterized protein (DUF924 family)